MQGRIVDLCDAVAGPTDQELRDMGVSRFIATHERVQ